jgi:predicted nucleic acid-binding protein
MAVLVDTGPLVAILSKNDHFHDICVKTLREIPAPLMSCWPVITEAAWLLREDPRTIQRLLIGSNGNFLELAPLSGSEAAIAGIMKRYAELRPQLADAALVYLADREKIDTIFTLDRRDFSVYRLARRTRFRLLPDKLS